VEIKGEIGEREHHDGGGGFGFGGSLWAPVKKKKWGGEKWRGKWGWVGELFDKWWKIAYMHKGLLEALPKN